VIWELVIAASAAGANASTSSAAKRPVHVARLELLTDSLQMSSCPIASARTASYWSNGVLGDDSEVSWPYIYIGGLHLAPPPAFLCRLRLPHTRSVCGPWRCRRLGRRLKASLSNGGTSVTRQTRPDRKRSASASAPPTRRFGRKARVAGGRSPMRVSANVPWGLGQESRWDADILVDGVDHENAAALVAPGARQQ
jgi:hypothetical protein